MNQILTNAHVVTPTEDFIGTVHIQNNIISAIDKTIEIHPDGLDLRGEWLTPGCIDIHSDYIEKELHPRPSASFPVSFAFHFMDQRAAACGITTLFTAISYAKSEKSNRSYDRAIRLSKAIDKLSDTGLIRHYIHSRLDPNSEEVVHHLDEMKKIPSLKLVVVNESIPGQRQYRLKDVEVKRAKMYGISLEEFRIRMAKEIEEKSKINKTKEIRAAFKGLIPLGSHDDTTIQQVEDAKTFGSTLSEMPTTIEAARKAKELNMWVCMGAPNYYRGGSHCGNLSCSDAIEENLVDMLCSDYHFPTMLSAVIKMIDNGMAPHEAINFVTLNPAKFLKMDKEIGSIEVGKKADLVAFSSANDFGQVSHVWVNGVLKLCTQQAKNLNNAPGDNHKKSAIHNA